MTSACLPASVYPWTYIYRAICLPMDLYLQVYLSTHGPIYRSICLPMDLYLQGHLSTHGPICTGPSVYPWTYIYRAICLPMDLYLQGHLSTQTASQSHAVGALRKIGRGVGVVGVPKTAASRFGLAVGWQAEGRRFESASALPFLQRLWSVDIVLWLCPSELMKH